MINTRRFLKDELISNSYVRLNHSMHASPRGFGASGRKHAQEITAMCGALTIFSILDYGCGQGTLKKELDRQDSFLISVREYDPAITGKSDLPSPAELVVCTDVLEHVEPEKLMNVLEHIHTLALDGAFLVIANTYSSKFLEDQRNAHLIVEKPDWWKTTLKKFSWDFISIFSRRDAMGAVADTAFWLRKRQTP